METQTKKTLQSYKYSSTTIAFTRVSQKPKVMSPQPFPRDVSINTVFGRGELGGREVEGREIEEKLVISLVWKPKKLGRES